ncbi:tetratricopeptide (TPR) repeat protein [Sphingomonas naasensis]|uniref:DUF4034 domain-containing protein n=1 Tax=Sphingomonas naasensis TaxID=1344951 RepID=A0A4S1WNS9_9SPHN|nr:hypothetical protein [Sphingomonas naasensis]NIJ20465.1 tetratricopeptide (TPR) repeat protein [Sphingomonas naasensis]TGX44563.1 hypothetical protein E5A74_07245 [Sphingomonas naasensis]
MKRGINTEALASRMTGMLARGDWPGLKAAATQLPPEEAFTALRLLGERAPMDASIEALATDDEAAGLLLAGVLLQQRAGRVRGYGRAAEISEDVWETYVPLLERAQLLLDRAVAANPQFGVAAAWLMAASVDASEDDKAFAERALLSATGVPASGWGRLLSARTQKWGGSHEAMWRIARLVADRDPPGTQMLIARAHFEQQLWYEQFEDGPEAAAKAAAYFRDSAVLEEMDRASAKVLESDTDDLSARLLADNWFAFVWFMAGEHRRARPHLQRIGGDADPSAWQVAMPAKKVLRYARRRAGLWPWQ